MKYQRDRYPLIGWKAHELLWLEAALTLDAYDFLLACEDIVALSGRTVGAVAAKAKALRVDAIREAGKYATAQRLSLAALPAPVVAKHVSSVKSPSLAAMMGGHGKVGRSPRALEE